MALTKEQRLFCRLVAVEGMRQGAAYAQAFGVKPNSAATLAGRLLKKVEIVEEINRLSTRAEEVKDKAALWSKAERMERLQAWAEGAAEVGRIGDAVRCVDLLNKMDGAYEPERVEVTGDEAFRAAVLGRTCMEPMVRGGNNTTS